MVVCTIGVRVRFVVLTAGFLWAAHVKGRQLTAIFSMIKLRQCHVALSKTRHSAYYPVGWSIDVASLPGPRLAGYIRLASA